MLLMGAPQDSVTEVWEKSTDCTSVRGYRSVAPQRVIATSCALIKTFFPMIVFPFRRAMASAKATGEAIRIVKARIRIGVMEQTKRCGARSRERAPQSSIGL